MPSGGEILISRVHKYALLYNLPTTEFKLTVPSSYKYGEFSDCKIICGSYEFDVHKVIICGHSDYFKISLKQNTFKVR